MTKLLLMCSFVFIRVVRMLCVFLAFRVCYVFFASSRCSRRSRVLCVFLKYLYTVSTGTV